MRRHGVPVLLTSDPIDICYATGARNMTVFGLMAPSRFLLLFADGPAVLFDFAGCAHLAADLPTVDEIREAAGITPTSGSNYRLAIAAFAGEVAAECRRFVSEEDLVLAVERVDFLFTDELRDQGLVLRDATVLFQKARLLKLPAEIVVMREAVARVQSAVAAFEAAIHAGSSEVEVWSELWRSLIASGGEYVSTRLVQSGPRTFPYFQEAGQRKLRAGELLCLDTDAIGVGGYAVDFSRTFLCPGRRATRVQRSLFALAHDQLQHNASLLRAGRSFEEFARQAWKMPSAHQPFGYYVLAHGLGLSGEHPYVPRAEKGLPYTLAGDFEEHMVICVESYIGDPVSKQGVKLEDQYLVTSSGAELLTTYPFDAALSG
jgi:Xaa-Pro aminopeptidase